MPRNQIAAYGTEDDRRKIERLASLEGDSISATVIALIRESYNLNFTNRPDETSEEENDETID